MIQLDIISDPICPWCYIGKAHLDRAVAQTGTNPFTTNWRIFQLNPWMPPEGMDRKTYLETKFGGPDKAKEIYARIEGAAREAGVDVDFSLMKRTPNTMDAHRLILWARTTGSQSAVVDELFRRYFREGADISDHEVLLDVAEKAGMERALVAELLASDADREMLTEEDTAARNAGVSGVPTFVIGGKYVLTGAQPPDVWVRVIGELTEALVNQPEASAP